MWVREDKPSKVAAPENLTSAELAVYDGIRITLEGRLGAAKLPLQVDVGFGDAVTPAPVEASVP